MMNPTQERKATEDDKCMTLRQLIDQLNQIPEQHKDKVLLSISGNTIHDGHQHIAMHPNSRLTWHCNGKLITFGFVRLPNEDIK